MRRHRCQHRRIGRVAEILVQQFFGIGQGAAQFAHHAAHGLLVADLAVQLLHPGLQRLGRLPGLHLEQTARQGVGMRSHRIVSYVQRGEGRLQVQHGRGHLHRHFRRRRLGLGGHAVHHLHQGPGQGQAARMQLDQGIADQGELVHGRFAFLDIPPGQGRPDFGGRRNPLARLGQQVGVETAKPRLFVIDDRMALQVKGLVHRTPDHGRGLPGVSFLRRLGTEEQHVLQQPLGCDGIAFGQGRTHRQQPRGHAFGVDVGLEQAVRHRIEKRRGHLPEDAHLHIGLGLGKTQADFPHALASGGHLTALDDLQDRRIQHLAGLGAIAQRRHLVGQRRVAQSAFHRPQVGRVHLGVVAEQGLHVAVLREQRHGRDRLAGQHRLQELQQGKAGFFQGQGDGLGAVRRLLHIVLHRRFHGPQQQRGLRHAHHVEGTAGLVQLLLGHAQGTAVQRRQVRIAGLFGLAHKTTRRLDGGVHRLAQFVKHPGQRSEIPVALGNMPDRCGGFSW